jgi:hypothetical protein
MTTGKEKRQSAARILPWNPPVINYGTNDYQQETEYDLVAWRCMVSMF